MKSYSFIIPLTSTFMFKLCKISKKGKDKKEDLSKKSAYEIIDLEIFNHKYLSNREE